MAGWDEGNGESRNEEGKPESDAPLEWLHSQADSRTHNEGQSPSSDVVSTRCSSNQGYDSDLRRSPVFAIGKRQAAFVTTVIPFDIQMTHLTEMKLGF